MFQGLTENLTKIFDKIKKAGVLTEKQIDSTMRDVRIALISADVALPVIKDFIKKVTEKAKGQEVIKSISPAQMIIKIINDEIISLLSPNKEVEEVNLNTSPPVNMLIVGLQGSGKTTSTAKLALNLKKRNKKLLLVSLDTYRPAAQEQLEILSKQIGVDSLEIKKEETPLEIANRALSESSDYDVVIYDSAGRLHIDDEMIDEVSKIKNIINPTETLLVVDSMVGQDAISITTNFDNKLSITGVILSRIDGDARGGAALSIRYATGKPIKFLSVGEKVEDLQKFDAKRIASRILDMGDVVSLVEKAASIVDQEDTEKAAIRIQQGKFNLNDYASQMKILKKLGGFGSIMSMIPGMSKFANKLSSSSASNDIFTHQQAIISSMTKKERRTPDILNASRKKRVAEGSGTTVQEINKLLKQVKQIKTTMKQAMKMGNTDPKLIAQNLFNKFSS